MRARSAVAAGLKAINDGQTHYCPSPGLPSFREAAAENYKKEFGVAVTADNIVVGPGAKVFEQFFCEAFLDPGDAVLIFSPHFPTYEIGAMRKQDIQHGAVDESCLTDPFIFEPVLAAGERELW